MAEERHSKRLKLGESGSGNLQSLERQISPPPSRKDTKSPPKQFARESPPQDEKDTAVGNAAKAFSSSLHVVQNTKPRIPSPFQLTKIQDLPDDFNVDTVTLDDLLGRENLKEVWLFDYLFDLD